MRGAVPFENLDLALDAAVVDGPGVPLPADRRARASHRPCRAAGGSHDALPPVRQPRRLFHGEAGRGRVPVHRAVRCVLGLQGDRECRGNHGPARPGLVGDVVGAQSAYARAISCVSARPATTRGSSRSAARNSMFVATPRSVVSRSAPPRRRRRGASVGSMRDDLGNERVVFRWHDAAAATPESQRIPGPPRLEEDVASVRETARRRAQDPRRRSVPRSRGHAPPALPGDGNVSPAAIRICELDEVDAADHLGHRVLDLEARVHLEEVELVVGDEELDASRTLVPDTALVARTADSRERVAQPAAQVRRRRFLDHLLKAPLQGALAFERRAPRCRGGPRGPAPRRVARSRRRARRRRAGRRTPRPPRVRR